MHSMRTNRLHRLGRLALAVAGVLFIAWGTFSAVAVFAVRYDLWPSADSDDRLSHGIAVSPLPAGSTLGPDGWAFVVPPQEVWQTVRADPALRSHAGGDAAEAAWPVVRAALLWDPETSRAVWIVHASRPGCPCPLDAASRWDHVRVLVDPLSGGILSVRKSEGLSVDEFRQIGIADWIGAVTHADAL